MKHKLLLITFTLIFLFSCEKKQEVETIVRQFVAQKIPDRREVVFDVNVESKDGKLALTGQTDSETLKAKLVGSLQAFKFDDQIVVLPDSSVGSYKFGLANLSVANLRARPAHSAELTTQVLMGTPLKILKKEQGWYMVQTPDHYISWVDDGGLTLITEEELEVWRKVSRAIILSELEFMTSGISNPSEIISDLTMGNIVEVIGQEGNYLNVRLPDGRSGFIPQSCCLDLEKFKNSVHPEKDSLMKLSKSFTGRPYLWGGTSSRAMDCSGFTKMVYYMHGVILARDASLQTKHGTLIQPNESLNNFEPGDLLFFGRDSSHVSHVAMSLGGDVYINASGKITENSFNPEKDNYSKSRKNGFIRCRRIFGNEGTEGIQLIKDHPWY